MTRRELKRYVKAAGGKTFFAAIMGISERYVEMLLKGSREVNDNLADHIRLKIKVDNQ